MTMPIDASAPETDEARETPFTRVRDLFSYAFSKADYDDPHVHTPSPLSRGKLCDQVPETPVELREFGTNTVFVMAGGLAFGGITQWWTERKAPAPSIPSGFSQAEKAKFMGELKTRQLIRILNSTLRGGLWCGWMGALYFGIEGLSAYARQTEDPWNTVMGAWACGSVFGFSVGGPGLLSRLRSMAGAVFLAGLAGYPMGLLHVAVNTRLRSSGQDIDMQQRSESLVEEPLKEKESTANPYPIRDYDVVGAVIGKLDQSLQESERHKGT